MQSLIVNDSMYHITYVDITGEFFLAIQCPPIIQQAIALHHACFSGHRLLFLYQWHFIPGNNNKINKRKIKGAGDK